jgi:hypothetical protein
LKYGIDSTPNNPPGNINPTFDGQTIFNSSSLCPGLTSFPAGALTVLGNYGQIIQKFHINGAASDTYLYHGYHDLAWTFKGDMYQPDKTTWIAMVNALQVYVNKSETMTFTLKDSYGLTWPTAMFQNFSFGVPHYTTDGGIVATLNCQGIVSGQPTATSA